MKPIIAVSINTSPPGDEKRSISKGVELQYIQLPYMQFILAGGGFPVLVPNLREVDEVPELVRRLDALVVIGGVDVDPSFYGEDNRHAKGCDPVRDRMEIELVREARRQSKPLLGICRGMQVISVALGGDLYQDIPTQIPGARIHHREPDGPENYHPLRLTRSSPLDGIFGADECRVNSSHHQSVREPGEGMEVVAVADDGVVEAIVSRVDRCLLAVQWHPERMPDDPKQVALAQWFISMAG